MLLITCCGSLNSMTSICHQIRRCSSTASCNGTPFVLIVELSKATDCVFERNLQVALVKSVIVRSLPDSLNLTVVGPRRLPIAFGLMIIEIAACSVARYLAGFFIMIQRMECYLVTLMHPKLKLFENAIVMRSQKNLNPASLQFKKHVVLLHRTTSDSGSISGSSQNNTDPCRRLPFRIRSHSSPNLRIPSARSVNSISPALLLAERILHS